MSSRPGDSPGVGGRSAAPRALAERGVLPAEAALVAFWNAARLPPGCRTTDGRKLEVVYRGQWSHGYGPDFRGAILCLDNGRTIRGDVEIHVTSSAWARHGHPGNPGYDSVVLHVVWLADVPIPGTAPVLELSRHISPDDLRDLPGPGRLDESFCAVFRDEGRAAGAVRIIEAAGDARFEARCVALEGELACEEPGQVLYAALMECMGYSENKLPFRLLAEALPLRSLTGGDRDSLAAQLQAASGIEPGPAALLRWEQWSLARVRPANHPLRRLLAVAHLLSHAGRRGGLVRYLAADAVPEGAGKLLGRLQVHDADGASLIGTDRAVEVACNAVLPFTVALARTTGDTALEHAAREAWLQLPRSTPTRVERSMREHLQVPARTRHLNTARHQQGLLHLYKRYCAQRLCELCPLALLADASDSG